MIAIYPGSFDPFTMGHMDIVERASKIVDRLIVGLLINPLKTPMFTVEERMMHLGQLVCPYQNVEVMQFSGLQVDFARKIGAKILIRGLRTTMDFENEMQMAMANKQLAPELETMFIVANPLYSYVSSSVVKQIACFEGDLEQRLQEMAPDVIIQSLVSRNKKNGLAR